MRKRTRGRNRRSTKTKKTGKKVDTTRERIRGRQKLEHIHTTNRSQRQEEQPYEGKNPMREGRERPEGRARDAIEHEPERPESTKEKTQRGTPERNEGGLSEKRGEGQTEQARGKHRKSENGRPRATATWKRPRRNKAGEENGEDREERQPPKRRKGEKQSDPGVGHRPPAW